VTTIRIGVAGWDYPDWNGIVYPPRAGRGFDRLAHVARYVDCVEINSSFYRPVAPRVAESWVRRTESVEGFAFTAKAHRSCTHDLSVDLDEAIGATSEGLRPLLEADRLTALLLQFPQSFHFDERARARLAALDRGFDGWNPVAEVRHASWQSDEARSWFAGTGLGWCAVDQPRVGRATAGVVTRVTGPVAYLRLHGRNAANWFREGAGRDARYDYLYARTELERLASSALEMAEQAENLVVVQNNHFRGQALANALQMKHLVEGKRPLAPGTLVAAYPELEDDTRVEDRGLF
jgi:uncharacterized protein YecE (DUF72 family)